MSSHRCIAAHFLFASLTLVGACGGGGISSSPTPVIQGDANEDIVDIDNLAIDSGDVEPSLDGCAENASNGCAQATISKISLIWNTPNEVVDGYLIYMGHAEEAVEMPIGDFPYTTLALIDSGLTVTIDLAETAPIEATDSVCFRLRSYNAYGLSGYSSPACVRLTNRS